MTGISIVRRARPFLSRRPRIAIPALVATLMWAGVVGVTSPSTVPAASAQKPVLESKIHDLSRAAVKQGWSKALDTGLPTEAIGFEWAGKGEGTVEVRARVGDAWGPWQAARGDTDEGPDPGSREARNKTAAGPVWVGRDVSKVEVRVVGGELSDLKMHAIRSERATGVSGMQPAAASLNAPAIISRAAWGADESFRTINPGCSAPEYANAVRYAVLHHTDTGNDYQQADGPALVRSIYYFHTHTNGWCDIGYNLLIDRYGQVYEGRFGGVAQPVVGAHAANYNTGSTGIALIGNFSNVAVPGPMYSALRTTLGWKMSIHGVNPRGQVTVNGRVINTIVGHRDVNPTDCPGQFAYGLLDTLRNQVASDIEGVVGLPRVGVINSCGGAYVKEGSLSAPFNQQLNCGDARAVVLGTNRIGVINSCGGAYVKEGALNSPFNAQLNCGDARAVALTSERVGVISGCSAAYVKEGALSSPFRQQLNCNDGRAIAVGGTTLSRLGVINACGGAYVKEGPLNTPFYSQLGCGDGKAIAVSSNRVGVINGCGAFYVKEGGLFTPFHQQTGCGDARNIAVINDRIALVNGCGALFVKEGPLNSPFNQLTSCNDAFATALAGDRVGVISGCGAAYVKEGPLSNPFKQQLNCGDARSLALSAF
ncbi:MAG TPA: peptidoglycan recognition protein [Acidimicrobiales bacterium]|nr:peptidoglycan recognition protein [Acidimicrobiales bacterium]